MAWRDVGYGERASAFVAFVAFGAPLLVGFGAMQAAWWQWIAPWSSNLTLYSALFYLPTVIAFALSFGIMAFLRTSLPLMVVMVGSSSRNNADDWARNPQDWQPFVGDHLWFALLAATFFGLAAALTLKKKEPMVADVPTVQVRPNRNSVVHAAIMLLFLIGIPIFLAWFEHILVQPPTRRPAHRAAIAARAAASH